MNCQQIIKKIKNELCIDSNELGKMAGISSSAIYYYLRGTRKPRMSTVRKLKKIADKLGIKTKPDEFLR